MESWLRIRDAWFMRLEKESSLAMSNQNWRTLLSIDFNVPEKGPRETKAARRRQESLAMLMPTSDMYPGVKMRSGSMGPMVWQGKEYPPGVLPPEDVVRQILWELYEVNFIHELLSLDRRACANLDVSDTAQLFERQIKISRCFPTSSFRHVPIPSINGGLRGHCKILLSTILQLFWTCSSNPPPPFCYESIVCGYLLLRPVFFFLNLLFFFCLNLYF